MQDCFRQHPDVYGSELDDDEDGAPPANPEGGEVPATSTIATTSTPESDSTPSSSIAATTPSEPTSPSSSTSSPSSDATQRAQAAKEQMGKEHSEILSESEELVPKAAHDATGK